MDQLKRSESENPCSRQHFYHVFYHVLFCVTNMADGSQHEIRKFILVSTVIVFFFLTRQDLKKKDIHTQSTNCL